MPFINGRYYVNPIMGQALEAAREAEAALAALENRAQQNAQPSAGGDNGNEDFDGAASGRTRVPRDGGDGPIHRVEIEAAELVPANSGRAARGYVARVHRQSATAANGPQSRAGVSATRSGSGAGHAETHVFADHRDLVSFLRDEFAKDGRSAKSRGQSA